MDPQELPPLGLTQGVPPAALVGPEELARAAGIDEILRLGSNESPFGPSPKAWVAMERSLNDAHRYGDPSEHDLRGAIAARHGVTPAAVTLGAGVDDLLGLAVRAFLAPGMTAITSLGGFPTFEMHAHGFQARIVKVPYHANASVDLDGLLDAARQADGSIVYLANPDNPTGSWYGRTRIAQLVAALPKRTLVIHDEAYANFLPAAERYPEGQPDARVIRMRTFSKEYGMAGLRVGYAVAAPPVIAAFDAIRLLYGVSRVAQAGALASLQDDGFVADVVARIEEGRADYVALGAELGLPAFPSSANFVLFGCGTAARAKRCLDQLLTHGIHIRKPPAPPLDHCIRISVGTPEQRRRLAKSLRTIVRVL